MEQEAFARQKGASPTSVKLRLIWLRQAASGSGAMPATLIRRVPSPMMKDGEPRQPATGPDVHRNKVRAVQTTRTQKASTEVCSRMPAGCTQKCTHPWSEMV